MDIKEYIASGIIENYILGSASVQEQQEVECMAHIYPEIKTVLSSFQTGIEKMALKSAVDPPKELKEKIMASIREIQQEKAVQDTQIVALNQAQSSKRSPSFYMAAASLFLLIGIASYAFFLKNDLSGTEADLATTSSTLKELEAEYDELNATNGEISDQMAIVQDQMAFLRNTDTKKIKLNGASANYEDNLATVFWNETSEKVLLDVQNLPETTSEESYQLWVLVDGEPKDMGVFNFENLQNETGLIEMKATAAADAFAITREPLGGSESPTLENLHVIGTI